MASGDSVLESLLECSLCLERYDMDERKPKIMDCAHTYCLSCLTKHVRATGKICPTCRQPFTEAPFFLKNNFTICGALDAVAAGSSSFVPSAPEIAAVSLRFFCTRCNRDASDACLLKGHDVCDKTGLVLKRATAAKDQARRQFEREAATLKDLGEGMEAFFGAIGGKGGLVSRAQRELAEVKKQREVLDKTSKLVMDVPVAAFQDNGDVPRALDKFLLANSERLFALEEQRRMLDVAKKCTVAVLSDESGGPTKTLSIGPQSSAEDRALAFLVYLMLNAKGESEQPGAAEGAVGGAVAAADASSVVSLDSLIADVKKCIIEGDSSNGTEDDSDDDSDTTSVVSEASSIATTGQKAKRVFVAKIPIVAKPEEIKELFLKFGRVLHIHFLSGPKKAKSATENGPKYHSALVTVPDDATVENILRNRPIVYEKKGQFGRCLLHVQEDNTGKNNKSCGAKQQRRPKKFAKKNVGGEPAMAKDNSQGKTNEAARRIFANQVPLDSTENDLMKFFSKYGAVESVTKRRHGVGQRCFAFITFMYEKSIAQVLKARPIMYNGFDLQVREYRDNARTTTSATQSALAGVSKPEFLLAAVTCASNTGNVRTLPKPYAQQQHPQLQQPQQQRPQLQQPQQQRPQLQQPQQQRPQLQQPQQQRPQLQQPLQQRPQLQHPLQQYQQNVFQQQQQQQLQRQSQRENNKLFSKAKEEKDQCCIM